MVCSKSLLKNPPFFCTAIPIQIPIHIKMIGFWMLGSENYTDMTNWDQIQNYIVQS